MKITKKCAMTDMDVLDAVLWSFGADYFWQTDKILIQGNRMFRFNDDGELTDIKEG